MLGGGAKAVKWGRKGERVRIDRSMEPLAINWPAGSKRVAKTSPEWPALRELLAGKYEV